MLKQIVRVLLLSLCFFNLPAIGQTNIVGDWYGSLEIGGGVLVGGVTLTPID